MNVEVILLFVCGGLTLLGYMIAINAHGPMRLGLSYLLATFMLAGTVWVVVQELNRTVEQRMQQELAQKDVQMQATEEQLRAQQQQMQQMQQSMGTSRERSAYAVKLNAVASEADQLASALVGTDLQDRSIDLDGLIGRAAASERRVEEIKRNLSAIEPADSAFAVGVTQLKGALQLLGEAAHYWRVYYSSEDSDQEELRERVMRQKARSAREVTQRLVAATTVAP